MRLERLRSFVALVSIAFAAACVTRPPEPVFPVRASGSVSDTYGCAIRAVNDVQYSVMTADRASGVFVAQRAQRGGVYVDRLSVNVYPDTAGHTELRVVADSRDGEEIFPPSPEGRTARNEVIRSCGEPLSDK
jgi:hypothetical protein